MYMVSVCVCVLARTVHSCNYPSFFGTILTTSLNVGAVAFESVATPEFQFSQSQPPNCMFFFFFILFILFFNFATSFTANKFIWSTIQSLLISIKRFFHSNSLYIGQFFHLPFLTVIIITGKPVAPSCFLDSLPLVA